MNDVLWTLNALVHLDDIGAYIAYDNPTAADRMVSRIVGAVDGLRDFAGIGREGRIPETRELVVRGTPYIVVYRGAEQIEILAVYHSSRDWPATV